MTPRVTLRKALEDPGLLGSVLDGPSWHTWRSLLIAAMGEPLTPEETKTFMFDFTVFRGNSGGPVYFFKQDPTYGGVHRMGTAIYGIMGLVVRERNITQRVEELYEKRETVTPLQLGEVIHARFIKELIDSMDIRKKEEN